jgi:hypothetical protein
MRILPLLGILTATLALAGAGPGGFDPMPPRNDSNLQCISRLDGNSLVRQCTSNSVILILITTPDGRSTLSAKVNGEPVYDGPYTTPEERAKVPREVSLQLRLGIIREKSGITDSNEWAVMSQKIQRVLELQDLLAEASPADMLAYSRHVPPIAPVAPAPPAPANADNQLATCLQKLAKGLDPQFPDVERKALNTAVRDTRKKLLDQLQIARNDLLKVSAVRQESIFIHLGILE